MKKDSNQDIKDVFWNWVVVGMMAGTLVILAL